MRTFPADFLWGAATSAHQVEGDNIHNDWWQWEKTTQRLNPSAGACRQYELYPDDFALAKELGHNAHRISIEWSRIEPHEGVFSEDAILHYRNVIQSMREQGLKPVVTLHHFTNPLWFAQKGGWEKRESISYFLRFVARVVSAYASEVGVWLTVNEPMVYAYHAYIIGVWPPQKHSIRVAKKVMRNLCTAHIRSYRLIHSLYQQKALPRPSVSAAQNVQVFQPCGRSIINRVSAYLRDRSYNLDFLNKAYAARALDFIGINYYSRQLVDVHGFGIWHFLFDACIRGHAALPKNSLGWEIYPEGLYILLKRLARFRLPVLITENGVCTDDDAVRVDFIRQHLAAVARAMQEGVRVSGYLYWSLLDNYEWDKGFAPHFGLVSVDYQTQKRIVRHSALEFKKICQTGVLPSCAH